MNDVLDTPPSLFVTKAKAAGTLRLGIAYTLRRVPKSPKPGLHALLPGEMISARFPE